MGCVHLLCLLLLSLELIPSNNQLWDVTEDQEAVNLVREMQDAQQMAKFLLDHAMAKFSSDNVTVMVIRFKGVAN
jgi:protein phosphatase PTC1